MVPPRLRLEDGEPNGIFSTRILIDDLFFSKRSYVEPHRNDISAALLNIHRFDKLPFLCRLALAHCRARVGED